MIKTNTEIEEYEIEGTNYYFELVKNDIGIEYWLYIENSMIKVLMLIYNNYWNTKEDILEQISKTYEQDIEEYEQYIREKL